ncbi:hypothetical protein BTH42_31975 [Burkholderia sp. SRS-W-2-2016]|nr:hypothetical protein BTH42_31975 [Burkholderia sp. SRS-W-2-2016]
MPLAPGDALAPAAHKEHVAFGMTRLLDFAQFDSRRQAGLQQYLERAATLGMPLQQGDLVGMCIVPAKTLFYGYAWEVEEPEAGVTFTIRRHSNGEALATVNGAYADSNGEAFALPVWMHDNDIIDVELTSWPANGVFDLRFSVSPIVFWPKIGN